MQGTGTYSYVWRANGIRVGTDNPLGYENAESSITLTVEVNDGVHSPTSSCRAWLWVNSASPECPVY